MGDLRFISDHIQSLRKSEVKVAEFVQKTLKRWFILP